MKFHIFDNSLQCKKFLFKDFIKQFLKKDGCYLYVILDKDKNSKIYRICIALNINFFTDYFFNNKELKLMIIKLFGKLKINDKNITYLKPVFFNYNKIKIDSKFSLCIYLLFRSQY